MSALYSFPHHSPCPGFLLTFLPVCWAFSWTNHHKPNEISWPPSLMERVLFPPTHTYSSTCVSSTILQLSGSQPLSQDLHSSSSGLTLALRYTQQYRQAFSSYCWSSLLDHLRKNWAAWICFTPRGDHHPTKTNPRYLHTSTSQVPEVFRPAGFIDSFNIISSTSQSGIVKYTPSCSHCYPTKFALTSSFLLTVRSSKVLTTHQNQWNKLHSCCDVFSVSGIPGHIETSLWDASPEFFQTKQI